MSKPRKPIKSATTRPSSRPSCGVWKLGAKACAPALARLASLLGGLSIALMDLAERLEPEPDLTLSQDDTAVLMRLGFEPVGS